MVRRESLEHWSVRDAGVEIGEDARIEPWTVLAGSTVTGVAIEFGTIGPLQVLEALVADNWLHRRGVFDSAQATHIKAQLRAAFYTDNDVWRGMVLGQSLVACRQAVAGLQT